MDSCEQSNNAFAWTDHYVGTRTYGTTAQNNANKGANGLNQYVEITSSAVLKPSYDPNGNLTCDGDGTNMPVNDTCLNGTKFTYDGENRLTQASGATNATLTYDPLGRLSQETSSSSNTRLLWDGDALVAEYDVATGLLARRYVHGPNVDEPIVWYEGSTRRYLYANHQGSIIMVADATGNALSINSYDEYGIPKMAGNMGRFAYTGQIRIPALGLYYYKARMYSPTLGRFMQTDPIGYKDQFNLYAYVGNDPVNKTDPKGMYECLADECKKVAPLVSRLQYFANNFKPGNSRERAALADAKTSLQALGTENDGNGLTVSSASLNDNYGASDLTLGEAGGSELRLDYKAIDIAAKRNGDNDSSFIGAAVLGHEATHIAQKGNSGGNLSVIFSQEEQAYTVESYIDTFYGNGRFLSNNRYQKINEGAKASCLSYFLNNVNTFPAPMTGSCK